MIRKAMLAVLFVVSLVGLGWGRSAQAEAPSSTAPSANRSAEDDCPGLLYPMNVGAKHGYIDHHGNIVISPQFNIAFPFGEDGFAIVYRGPKGGAEDSLGCGQPAVINRRGKVVLEGGFAALGCGRFAVRTQGRIRFVGLIEPFQTTVQCTDVIGPFKEGLLAMRIDGKWGFMDEQGKIAVEPRYNWVLNFEEGLAAAQMGEKCGYIDHTGRWVIEPQFDGAAPFREGLAPVTVGEHRYYIDPVGRGAFPGDFEARHWFSEGLAAVCDQKLGLYGYIDKSGQYRIPQKFKIAGMFSEGLAGVQLPDGSAGYINHAGEWVIRLPPGKWHASTSFRNGRAQVRLEDRQGYMDKSGAWIWSIAEDK